MTTMKRIESSVMGIESPGSLPDFTASPRFHGSSSLSETTP